MVPLMAWLSLAMSTGVVLDAKAEGRTPPGWTPLLTRAPSPTIPASVGSLR